MKANRASFRAANNADGATASAEPDAANNDAYGEELYYDEEDYGEEGDPN
jgi:hypothetical protein